MSRDVPGATRRALRRERRPPELRAAAALTAAAALVLALSAASCVFLGGAPAERPEQEFAARLGDPPAVVLEERFAPRGRPRIGSRIEPRVESQAESTTEVLTQEATGDSEEEREPFDHGAFDELLQEFVDRDGQVAYDALLASGYDRLVSYLESLQEVDFEALGRDEKLALLINAYNAFVLKLVLNHYPIGSVLEIPMSERWKARDWQIGNRLLTLFELENELLRGSFRDPRVHFAICRGANGAPPLWNHAYTAERIEEQLEAQARFVHEEDRFRYVRTGPQDRTVHLSQIYAVFASDFEQVAGSILHFAARYSTEVRLLLDEVLRAGRRGAPGAEEAPGIEAIEVRFLEYDWSLNARGVVLEASWEERGDADPDGAESGE